MAEVDEHAQVLMIGEDVDHFPFHFDDRILGVEEHGADAAGIEFSDRLFDFDEPGEKMCGVHQIAELLTANVPGSVPFCEGLGCDIDHRWPSSIAGLLK